MSESLLAVGVRAAQARQVSVFLENRLGVLAEVLQRLADAGINLQTMSLAETERFGIVRMLVDDPESAVSALDDLGVITQMVDVLAVEVPNHPGGLAEILQVFSAAGVSVRYLYAEMGGTADRAVLIMRLNPSEGALQVLLDSGVLG